MVLNAFYAYYVYTHFTSPGFLSFDIITLWIEKMFLLWAVPCALQDV